MVISMNMIHNKIIKTFDDIVHLLELNAHRLMFAKSNERTYVVVSNCCETFQV